MSKGPYETWQAIMKAVRYTDAPESHSTHGKFLNTEKTLYVRSLSELYSGMDVKENW